MPRSRVEQEVHRAVLEVRGVEGLVYLHAANGGNRRPMEAAVLTGLGLVAGAPDLLLWHDGKSFAIELKAAGGAAPRLSLICLAD